MANKGDVMRVELGEFLPRRHQRRIAMKKVCFEVNNSFFFLRMCVCVCVCVKKVESPLVLILFNCFR